MTQESSKSASVRWSSRAIFLLSAMGCTIGLGNIWRFPYITGENGGGVFILVYVMCLILLAAPGVMAELAIGKRGRAGAARSFENVAIGNSASKSWSFVGHLMVLGGLLVLFYYPVIGSWSIEYAAKSLSGALENLNASNSQGTFDDYMASSNTMAIYFTIFHGLAVLAVFRGLNKGIESAIKFTMPLFFLMLIGLLVYTAITVGIGSGLKFMFAFDFSKLSPALVLAACGQAIFSTAVGQANLLAYATYIDDDMPLQQYGGYIVAADTCIAILAGILIFSIVFAFDLSPAAGTGLAYSTLPVAFASMPAGNWIGSAFFVLLTLAAYTSTIPAIEVVSRWLSDHANIRHSLSALVVGALTWVVGLIVVFSLAPDDNNLVSELSHSTFGTSLIEVFDGFASNIILPVSVLLLAVFAGWIVSKTYLAGSLGRSSTRVVTLLQFMLRFVVPVVIAGILIANLLK